VLPAFAQVLCFLPVLASVTGHVDMRALYVWIVGTTCSASLLAGLMSWVELQPPHHRQAAGLDSS